MYNIIMIFFWFLLLVWFRSASSLTVIAGGGFNGRVVFDEQSSVDCSERGGSVKYAQASLFHGDDLPYAPRGRCRSNDTFYSEYEILGAPGIRDETGRKADLLVHVVQNPREWHRHHFVDRFFDGSLCAFHTHVRDRAIRSRTMRYVRVRYEDGNGPLIAATGVPSIRYDPPYHKTKKKTLKSSTVCPTFVY